MERNLNALLAVIIGCALVIGFGIQIFKHEQPCPLCLLQRLGMLGVASGALMNVKFGIQSAHYGLSLLSAIAGGSVSLRHIVLHICPNFPQWGTPFLGLSLYTWAFLAFAFSIFYIALLLLLFNKKRQEVAMQERINGWGFFAFALIFLVCLGNIGISLWLCGLGPCEG